MGQSNSRVLPQRPRSLSTPTPVQPHDHTPSGTLPSRRNDRENSNETIQPSLDNVRSRRSSFRRSVLGLVSRASSRSLSTSKEEKENESPTTTTTTPRPHLHSLRKRWRSSKRFSKLHPSSHVDRLEPKEDSRPGEAAVQEERRAAPEVSESIAESSYVEGDPEVLSDRERQLSENIGAWMSGTSPSSSPAQTMHSANSEGDRQQEQPETRENINIEQEISDFLNVSPDNAVDSNHNSSPSDLPPSDPSLTHNEQNPPTSPTTRAFPPPGTLVVVQGVVNTTDAPHPSASSSRPQHLSTPRPSTDSTLLTTPPTPRPRRSASAPRPGPGHRASYHGDERRHSRSGLSSLLPRPTSMISRRPSSSSGIPSSSIDQERRSLDLPNTQDIGTEDASYPRPESSAETAESGGRPLSPGSIDVLGTLLSVAAAATAASLFSPGFAQPPNSSGLSPAQSPSDTTRPLSPTPTAGLGGFGGLNGLAGLNLDPSSDQQPQSSNPIPGDRDARDRIRNVWESFRERLGLTPRNVEGESPRASTEQTTRMRPGELMLAEMARALNAGLGLGSNQSETARTASDSTSSDDDATLHADEPPRSSSPEAGFERFLMNLQADLRTVLSEDHSQPESNVSASGAEQVAEATQTEPVDLTSPLASADSETASFFSAMESTPTVEEEETMTEHEYAPEIDELGSAPGPSHPRTPTPIPTSTLPHPSGRLATTPDDETNRGPQERRRPAINLWRIYRFQPITVPGTVNANDGQTSALTSTSPLEQTSQEQTSTTPSQNGDGTDGENSTPAVDTTALPNVVVPVIVVGLQSVETGDGRQRAQDGQGHAHAPQDDLQDNIPYPDVEDTLIPSDDALPPSSPTAANGRPGSPRGRTWHSRAANALRGLRPGRRANSRNRNGSDGSGSRTFLIYVIGGYYPPNHHMVTGSDVLDTYEALWELAELLGQVKPPVATKEDIDNSGLQIIKASEMRTYEGAGRLASNCVDRCLICLDDYDAEDDIRLMTCKHAFHKDCVDKWLQVGRNNCPACRSKGVTTSGDSAVPSTPNPVSSSPPSSS
ncbi:hypothetical protein ABKN59_008410 [Abortiporus biennis]